MRETLLQNDSWMWFSILGGGAPKTLCPTFLTLQQLFPTPRLSVSISIITVYLCLKFRHNLDFLLPTASYSQLFTTSCWFYFLNIRTVSRFSSLCRSPRLGMCLLSAGNSNFLQVSFSLVFPPEFYPHFQCHLSEPKFDYVRFTCLRPSGGPLSPTGQSWRSSTSWPFWITMFLYPLAWAWYPHNIKWLGISSLPHTPSLFLLASSPEILAVCVCACLVTSVMSNFLQAYGL